MNLVCDVSRFQGPDYPFAALAAAGVRGVYIEATRGNDSPNPYFREQVDAALAAGLAVGAYHFCYPLPDSPGHVNRDPLGQANLFWQTAEYLYAQKGAQLLPPMADCEWPEQPAFGEWSVTPTSIARWIVSFCAHVDAIFLRTCGVYAGPWWWSLLPAGEVAGLSVRPLWVSEYPVGGPLSSPPTSAAPRMAPWGSATLWQFTDDFEAGGCSRCDGGVFLGDEVAWQALLSG